MQMMSNPSKDRQYRSRVSSSPFTSDRRRIPAERIGGEMPPKRRANRFHRTTRLRASQQASSTPLDGSACLGESVDAVENTSEPHAAELTLRRLVAAHSHPRSVHRILKLSIHLRSCNLASIPSGTCGERAPVSSKTLLEALVEVGEWEVWSPIVAVNTWEVPFCGE